MKFHFIALISESSILLVIILVLTLLRLRRFGKAQFALLSGHQKGGQKMANYLGHLGLLGPQK